jgi:tetratricopeptide (TPR) repeat protein/O-antigen ligase
MRTKVSAFCDHIIEAGWILALIIVPLFFNVHSSRVFEPDKLGILRTLATLMAVAWLIKLVENPGTSTRGDEEGTSLLDRINNFINEPLVTPTIILSVIYILSTITSVVPRISLWGSYQRFQGTYTFLSYVVIFLLMIQNLRRRTQVQRLWMAAIFASLPVSMYGLVQHYRLDPLPWGGDVTFRVASNMGNAIFVGAYLIMVIPLTLARILHLQNRVLDNSETKQRALFVGFFWFMLAAQTWAWFALRFERGLMAGLLFIVLLALLARLLRRPISRFVAMGAYGLILCVQVTALVFSQSRGPQLGGLAALFFLLLLYLFVRNKLKAAYGFVALGVVGVALLIVLNLPSSPLAPLRDVPYIGRLGRVLEVQTGTGRVRVLIWEGVIEMLEANPLRSLIGYGPEAMYVAYNPYYPPELAQLEARNASPDRSHNETFDALVTTGLIGFVAYLLLFGSVFYLGLRALGLIRAQRQRTTYLGLVTGGAILGIVLPWIVDGSLRFAGVGLPMGFVAGVALYVVLFPWLNRNVPLESDQVPLQGWYLWLYAALVAAILGHFVEIHLGIAIAATRTYFWVYAAMLVVLGQRMIEMTPEETPLTETVVAAEAPRARSRRRGRRSRRNAPRRTPRASNPANRALYPMAIVAGLILATMAWNYTTNPLGQTNAFSVLVTSYTTMAALRAPEVVTMGLLYLFAATFLVMGIAIVAELNHQREGQDDDLWWLQALGRYGAIAGGIWIVYSLIHASNLGPTTDVPNLVYEYYGLVFLLWVALALVLGWRRATGRPVWRNALALAYPVLLIASLVFVNAANIRVVKADVLYKQGLRFDQGRDWDSAIYYYQQAIDVAPSEDFYRLFKGRALLEKAKVSGESQVRDAYFEEALNALRDARELNPLNTDHTANMARLYRTWGEVDSDPASKVEKLKQALTFYRQATQLSPNNAQLHNELGLTYYMLGDMERALERYRHSLTLDDRYIQTYLLMGDVYLRSQRWEEAIDIYNEALEIQAGNVQTWSALGYAYSQMEEYDKAIAANRRVLDAAPNDYSTLKNLAILSNQTADYGSALDYARQALAIAPNQEKPVIESFIQQMEERLEEAKS